MAARSELVEVLGVLSEESAAREAYGHPMTVLIADDDQKFRGAVKRFLAKRKQQFTVVGEGGDGEVAIRLARGLHPDVVLMDISMPRCDGLTATRRIKAELPKTKVVIMTVHEEEPYRTAAEESGADAFLFKKILLSELLPKIGELLPPNRDV